MISDDLTFMRHLQRLKPFPVEKTKMRLKKLSIFVGLVSALVTGVVFYSVRGKSRSGADDFLARNAALLESWDASRGEATRGGPRIDSHPPIQLRVSSEKKENPILSSAHLLQGSYRKDESDKKPEEANEKEETASEDTVAEKEEEKQLAEKVDEQQRLIELQRQLLEKLSAAHRSLQQKQQQQNSYGETRHDEEGGKQQLLKLLLLAQKLKQQQQREQQRPDQSYQQADVGAGDQQPEDPASGHPMERQPVGEKLQSSNQQPASYQLISESSQQQLGIAPNREQVTSIPSTADRSTAVQTHSPQQSQVLNQRVQDRLNDQSANQQITSISTAKPAPESYRQPEQRKEEDKVESEKQGSGNAVFHGGAMKLSPHGIQPRKKITISPALLLAQQRRRLSRKTTTHPPPLEERGQIPTAGSVHGEPPQRWVGGDSAKKWLEKQMAKGDFQKWPLQKSSWGRKNVEEKLENEMEGVIQHNDPFLEGEFEKVKSSLSDDLGRGLEPEVEPDTNIYDDTHEPFDHMRDGPVRTGQRTKVSVYDLGQHLPGKFQCVSLRRQRFSSPICMYPGQSPESLIRPKSWQEKALVEFLTILDKDISMGVVDLSAGVGVFTVAAAREKRHVVAVEPRRQYIPMFHKTMKSNSITQLVTLITDNMWGTISPRRLVTLDDALPVMKFTNALIWMNISNSRNVAQVLEGASRMFSTMTVKYVLMPWAPHDKVQCQRLAALLRRRSMEPVKTVNDDYVYSDDDLFMDITLTFVVWRLREKSMPDKYQYNLNGRAPANAPWAYRKYGQ